MSRFHLLGAPSPLAQPQGKGHQSVGLGGDQSLGWALHTHCDTRICTL